MGDFQELADARFAGRAKPVAEIGDDLPGASTIRAMLEHRSCRRYSGAHLDDQLLELVLSAAFSMPSKSEMARPVRFINA